VVTSTDINASTRFARTVVINADAEKCGQPRSMSNKRAPFWRLHRRLVILNARARGSVVGMRFGTPDEFLHDLEQGTRNEIRSDGRGHCGRALGSVPRNMIVGVYYDQHGVELLLKVERGSLSALRASADDPG